MATMEDLFDMNNTVIVEIGWKSTTDKYYWLIDFTKMRFKASWVHSEHDKQDSTPCLQRSEDGKWSYWMQNQPDGIIHFTTYNHLIEKAYQNWLIEYILLGNNK